MRATAFDEPEVKADHLGEAIDPYAHRDLAAEVALFLDPEDQEFLLKG